VTVYKVIRPFQYDERTFEVGETIDLSDPDTINQLYGVFIREPGKPMGDQQPDPAPLEPQPTAEGDDQ